MVAQEPSRFDQSDLIFSIMPVNPKKKLCPANKGALAY